jgi:UDP-N-acetylglucosamine 2-epimerase (non-hydrolysing)
MKLINVCGARPNFMKIAPLMRAYRGHPRIHSPLVHAGQHYDDRMNRLLFDEREIPRPHLDQAGRGA